MNRRHLFNLLVGGALAPELIVLPKRTYFLPPQGGWEPYDFSAIDADMAKLAAMYPCDETVTGDTDGKA